MRRAFVVLLSFAFVLAAALPAAAAKPGGKPEKGTSTYRSADAVWSTQTSTGRNSFTVTETYVYASEDGHVWVDQGTYRCRVSGRSTSCSWGSFDTYSGTGGFSIESDLSSATLSTTVSQDVRNGRTLQIAVTWTGTGALSKSRGSYSHTDECSTWRSSYRGESRRATATGSFGGTALGQSEFASLGSSVDRYSYREACGWEY